MHESDESVNAMQAERIKMISRCQSWRSMNSSGERQSCLLIGFSARLHRLVKYQKEIEMAENDTLL